MGPILGLACGSNANTRLARKRIISLFGIVTSMDIFFQRYANTPIVLAAEEILGGSSVYGPYLRALQPTEYDDDLRGYRQRALAGALRREDFLSMKALLELAKQRAQLGGFPDDRGPETPSFYAYARVNTLAMLLAQILFVDNVIKEGIMDAIDRPAAAATINDIVDFVLAPSKEKPPTPRESTAWRQDASFYGTLFAFQVAFDKLFVPDESIVSYDAASGEYYVTEHYEALTAYLELSNKKVLTASRAERDLCYEITTGWSEGVDRPTWDKLNEYYYAAKSPTTGEENLFVKNYDVILERMLPQFALSKVKLAGELIARGGESLRVLEVGAGSGAFAIDLAMASKRLGYPLDKIEYHGIEPSAYMREHFRQNVENKIGAARLPDTWRLVEGSLEAVDQSPDDFLTPAGDTVLIFSFSLHHCFGPSVEAFFTNPRIRQRVREAYVLEGTWEHGWTKPFYMWVDCESPENFENVLAKGDWDSETLWIEPSRPIEGHCVTLGWSCLRRIV